MLDRQFDELNPVLEVSFISDVGKRSNNECTAMSELINKGAISTSMIPRLDATLCRCRSCTQQASGGTYWVDGQMRDRLKRRVNAFPLLDASNKTNGDLCRDTESS